MTDKYPHKTPAEQFSLNIYLPVENQRKSADEYWRRLVAFLTEIHGHNALPREWYLQARNQKSNRSRGRRAMPLHFMLGRQGTQ
jgi:hypothetical protein